MCKIYQKFSSGNSQTLGCSFYVCGPTQDDFIAAYNESEDKFDEVIRDTKKEPPKGFNLRRTKSRAAPGTVKKLLARFENNN